MSLISAAYRRRVCSVMRVIYLRVKIFAKNYYPHFYNHDGYVLQEGLLQAFHKKRRIEYSPFPNLDLDDDEVDPNVVSIKFDCLKENVVKIHQGDPSFCKNCNIVLNKFSQVTEEAVENQFEQQMVQVWICEFCGHKNPVQIEREEIPAKEDVVYLI